MVDVAVLDRKVPVNGLTIDDFEVFDNGVRQTIDARSAGQVPLDVSIVLEMNHPGPATSYGDTAPRPWQPVQALKDVVSVAGLLKSGDRLRLIVAALDGTVEALALQPAAMAVERGAHLSPPAVSPRYTSTLFDGTAAALIAAVPPDRRGLVLIFTDGIDGASVLTPDQVIAGGSPVRRGRLSRAPLHQLRTMDAICIPSR